MFFSAEPFCNVVNSIGLGQRSGSSCFRSCALAYVLGLACAFSFGCSGKTDETPPAPVTAGASSAAVTKESESSFDVAESPYREGKSLLGTYYSQRFGRKETAAALDGVKAMLPEYSDEQAEQAAAVILDYQYIIYHISDQHNVINNHAVARQVEARVKGLCEVLDVPFVPVMGVICWENSGDAGKISFANAAGLGQLTNGAVEIAHHFGAGYSEKLAKESARLRLSEDREDKIKAERFERGAKIADCADRHAEAAAKNKVKDERLLIDNNLEDTVLYFKYLLTKYDDRADLAISAYHNGIANNDDIIYEYLRTEQNLELTADTDPNRVGLVEALERYNLTYLDLWNCRRTREMLCGLRTVYGDKANNSNLDLTLGDESDLYPWKVLGSYGGYKAGENFVHNMQTRYSGDLDLCQVSGLPVYDSSEKLDAAMDGGLLCVLDAASYKNCGVDAIPAKKTSVSVSKAKAQNKAGIKSKPNAAGKAANAADDPQTKLLKKKCWYTSPEMAGYLSNLQKRLAQSCGNNRVRLPLKTVSGAWSYGTAKDACSVNSMQTHYRQAAVDIAVQKLPAVHRNILEQLITEDFLLDVVYMRRGGDGSIHLVLNPRCGDDFIRYYVANVSPNGSIAKAISKADAAAAAEERAAAAAEEQKLKSNPQYRTKAAREKAMKERRAEKRRAEEAKAREAAQSRASAVKKREAAAAGKGSAKKDDPEKTEVQETEEEELFAIPDDVGGGSFSDKSSSKTKASSSSKNEVYEF